MLTPCSFALMKERDSNESSREYRWILWRHGSEHHVIAMTTVFITFDYHERHAWRNNNREHAARRTEYLLLPSMHGVVSTYDRKEGWCRGVSRRPDFRSVREPIRTEGERAESVQCTNVEFTSAPTGGRNTTQADRHTDIDVKHSPRRGATIKTDQYVNDSAASWWTGSV